MTQVKEVSKLVVDGNLSGVTTGLDTVNAKIGGMHHSDLMILAGRPGMGKTSLATNIAFNAAQRWMRDMRDGIPPSKSVGKEAGRNDSSCDRDGLRARG